MSSTAPHCFDKVVRLPGRRAAIFDRPGFPDMNAAAWANLPMRRFDDLPSAEMNQLLAALLGHPPIAALAFEERKTWLEIIFALADAERCGAMTARELALRWSASAPEKFNQAHFDRDWASFRPGGVTMGTLLRIAMQTGFDLSPWFEPPGSRTTSIPPAPAAASAAVTAFFGRVPFAAADLTRPPWLIERFAVRGDVAVVAGPGGSAKTVTLVDLLVCVAAGRQSWGGHRIRPRPDGKPHRVAIVSAEEDRGRIALLIAAACEAQALDGGERAAVSKNLLLHDARQSGLRVGAPRPSMREDMAPEADDPACAALRDGLLAEGITLVVLDTLAALLALPNENDNSAATTLMRRIGKIAAEAGCAVILLHHTPKLSKEGAAAQRGEATAVRGGGAIVNSARIVWTITGLPASEAGLFAMNGVAPNAIRRLDPVKLNDAAPPAPSFFEVEGMSVQVHDGSRESVRAIRFISPPQVGAVPDALRHVAMKALDAGVMVHGAKVALSPGSGPRNAVDHIARALCAANAQLSQDHAKIVARQVLGDLKDRLGCVTVTDVLVPKISASGTPNGFDKRKGLETQWQLAPWTNPNHACAPPSQAVLAAPASCAADNNPASAVTPAVLPPVPQPTASNADGPA
ncbi:AAA family ATPase [Pseudoroseomonas globiformis]|uniref:AAA family ATPase n=1 Tax=Teichococcus globiformis TaxID=2307229 RepID=A0ABV7FXH3_9PROT